MERSLKIGEMRKVDELERKICLFDGGIPISLWSIPIESRNIPLKDPNEVRNLSPTKLSIVKGLPIVGKGNHIATLRECFRNAEIVYTCYGSSIGEVRDNLLLLVQEHGVETLDLLRELWPISEEVVIDISESFRFDLIYSQGRAAASLLEKGQPRFYQSRPEEKILRLLPAEEEVVKSWTDDVEKKVRGIDHD